MLSSTQIFIIPERIAQKIKTRPGFFKVYASGLFTIYLQTKAPFEQRFREINNTTSHLFTHDYKVVSVSYYPSISPFTRPPCPVKGFVKPVQIQICK
jgi:hypothetical protein